MPLELFCCVGEGRRLDDWERLHQPEIEREDDTGSHDDARRRFRNHSVDDRVGAEVLREELEVVEADGGVGRYPDWSRYSFIRSRGMTNKSWGLNSRWTRFRTASAPSTPARASVPLVRNVAMRIRGVSAFG